MTFLYPVLTSSGIWPTEDVSYDIRRPGNMPNIRREFCQEGEVTGLSRGKLHSTVQGAAQRLMVRPHREQSLRRRRGELPGNRRG